MTPKPSSRKPRTAPESDDLSVTGLSPLSKDLQTGLPANLASSVRVACDKWLEARGLSQRLKTTYGKGIK